MFGLSDKYTQESEGCEKNLEIFLNPIFLLLSLKNVVTFNVIH